MTTEVRFEARQVLPPIEHLIAQLGPACHRIELAGAVRRGNRELDLVDLLAIPRIDPKRNLLWELLDGWKELLHGRSGEFSRVFYWPVSPDQSIQVNLYTARADTWGNALVHRTGPEDFWLYLVGRLREEGFISRNNEIIRLADNTLAPCREEEDFFALARAHVRPPQSRAGFGSERSSW